MSILTWAQEDTVQLNPVTVYGIRAAKYLAGSGVEKVDTAVRNAYASNHLGEQLSYQFPVYFRTYGSGMIAGISMRGTSPNHTAVLWNGININSFSLGQADFSMLPGVAFDHVSVHEGGGSARFGSGAFGGTVLLESGFDPENIFDVNLQAGSFNRYFGSVKASAKFQKLSTSSSVYKLQSENNFPVRNLGRQRHAAHTQQGFLQHVGYQFSEKRSATIDYWYHDADRQIQPTIGNQLSEDEQQDQNHRLSVSYLQRATSGYLKIGGGFVSDRIVYNGTKGDIFRLVGFAEHEYHFASGWFVNTSAGWNHIVGKLKEYGEHKNEDRVDVAVSASRELKRIKLSVNIRQPFVTGVRVPLLPYIGADYALVDEQTHQLILSGNASRNFRVPTLNDRYWPNAGRPDLAPEESYAAEVGIQWKTRLFSFRSRGFYQTVDQWIQWKPVRSAFYPENIMQVHARGVEHTVTSQWNTGRISQHFKLTYQFTRSTPEKAGPTEQEIIGKQLIYTPVHTASAFLSTKLSTWSLNIFFQYSGIRYLIANNSPDYRLDPYALTDIAISRVLTYSGHSFVIQVMTSNVFDVNYEFYSSRAMPGRNFNIQLSYQLKHKSR